MKVEYYELIGVIPHHRPNRCFCECGEYLYSVSNGFLGTAWFCKKCKNVYRLELNKVPKKQISAEYIEQCEKQFKGAK